jgi:hypothetical protein
MPIRSVSQVLTHEMVEERLGADIWGISDRGKLLSAVLRIFCSGSEVLLASSEASNRYLI